MQTFKDYSLSQPILKALDRLGYEKPTTVQKQVLEAFSSQEDLIVQSQTGSGKTMAFALPVCEAVDWEKRYPQALVLTPTRELALQIQQVFFKVGRFKRIKAVGLYGKAPFGIQQKELKQKTHVVVATPGRLLDHLEKGTIQTEEIRYLIIDEADEMLKMGFMEEVKQIIEVLPKKRQNLLFSATLPKDIQNFGEVVMHHPKHICITPEKVTSHQVAAYCYQVEENEKVQALIRLTQAENPECCMIFCNRKVGVEKVYQDLKEAGYACAMLHGGMEQRDRFRVMADFKKGYYRYLVCTDVAARGIDVKHVTYVVSFDVPEDKEQYVHRIGRTGRGKQTGRAAMLLTEAEKVFVAAIERYIGESLEQGQLPIENNAQMQEAFKEKMTKRIKMPTPETEAIHQDILKLHINAGKKTKMRPVDIVGTLCNLPGMCADDIGIIQIQDISTYVEILNGKGEKVYKLLQKTPIKGRMRRVSKVERRN